MAEKSVADESQEVTKRVYDALIKRVNSKSKKRKSFDATNKEALATLCTQLSSLNSDDVKIVFNLIKFYSKENPGTILNKNKEYPYNSQRAGTDLVFEEVNTMPKTLLALLDAYIDSQKDD